MPLCFEAGNVMRRSARLPVSMKGNSLIAQPCSDKTPVWSSLKLNTVFQAADLAFPSEERLASWIFSKGSLE
jgi:hypothetical protein